MTQKPQKNLQTEKYHLFLTNEFSQWYPSDFTSKEDIQFSCAEQYMMYGKALLFGDQETADKILKAETPKEYKDLGRQVKGFDAEVWDAHAREIVYQGNYYKFTQNPYLFETLIATMGKEIVEAAHYDPVWGIGLRADDPAAQDKANWKGKNWLGGTLTKLRDDLTTQGFKPTYTEDNSPMLKFYDSEGQRTLYISAKELAKQRGFCDVVNLINDLKYIMFLNKTNFQTMAYDPEPDTREPEFGAKIKGHGQIYNTQKDFARLNRGVLDQYGSRQPIQQKKPPSPQ